MYLLKNSGKAAAKIWKLQQKGYYARGLKYPMQLKSILESILFVCGGPISVKKLVQVTKKGEEEVLAAMKELREDCKKGGLVLLQKEDEWQMCSSPDNTRYIEEFVKGEFTEELSRAALETLAIVAYKGPLTRAQIEYLRGVNSIFTLRNLLMRGLIERTENPKDARSFLYKISMDLLRHFGLTSPDNLPQFSEFSKAEVQIATDK